MTKRKGWLVGLASSLALIVGILDSTSALAYVQTINGANFPAGNIITDAQMFDRNALTEAQIQEFLDAKLTANGGCDNSRCLAIYHQNTVDRPAKYGAATGALRCAAYTGAPNESAARIIYKIQQTCGISAKVILVTLQKEQGLVMSTSPTATSLTKAMGAGCPDGAACDPAYANFQDQVRYGASLLKWYTMPGERYYRSTPGTYTIRYDPDASCGSVAVRIQNQATSALYRYTPYTPDAAALANIWGLGGSCSAYGNRNFWRQYTMWFNLKTELYAQVAALPAATKSALGTVVDESGCPDTGNVCSITYQTGVVTLNQFPVSGNISVSYGAIGTAYRSLGGSTGILGAVVGGPQVVSGGANGDGNRQQFANGYIYELPNHSTVVVLNAINTVYTAQGGPAGVLGWPAAAQRCVGTVCDQLFANGVIQPNSTGQLVAVPGAIGLALSQAGGINATWGKPVDAQSNVTAGSFGSATRQAFVNGVAYFKAGSPVSFLSNSLAPALATAGGVATLGFPTGTTSVSGTTSFQKFGTSWLFGTTGSTAAQILTNPMADVWVTQGGATSYLGVLTGAAQAVNDGRGGSGFAATFTGGAIVTGPTGTFAYPNAMRTKFVAAGGIGGTLGWPTSNASLVTYMWTQNFQGGTLRTSTRPTVRKGMTDTNHIKYLQTKLGLAKMYRTGYFGDITLTAVLRYQRSHGLTANGIVDTKMWDLLG